MVWELELCIEVEKGLYGFRLCRLVEKLRTRNQKPVTRSPFLLGYLFAGKLELGETINGLEGVLRLVT